jgi:hypothetical protein
MSVSKVLFIGSEALAGEWRAAIVAEWQWWL